MNTKLLNFVAPLATVVFGVFGAVGTQAVEKTEAFAPVMGWRHVDGTNPCEEVQICSNSGSFDCTAPDGAQLYIKPGATCLVPLKRNTQ